MEESLIAHIDNNENPIDLLTKVLCNGKRFYLIHSKVKPANIAVKSSAWNLFVHHHYQICGKWVSMHWGGVLEFYIPALYFLIPFQKESLWLTSIVRWDYWFQVSNESLTLHVAEVIL